MKSRFKLALTVLVLLLALAAFSQFLGWMNLPSDLWFWSGILACSCCWLRFLPSSWPSGGHSGLDTSAAINVRRAAAN